MANDLMAQPPETLLPQDPADVLLAEGVAPGQVVRRYPASPTAWASVANEARIGDADDLVVYAFARVGYHRSLDLLRRNGWKGNGPVPWEHEPNRGFLRCVAVLARAAESIGESDEYQRCLDLLDDCDPHARVELGLT